MAGREESTRLRFIPACLAKVEASVARCLRTPPERCYPLGLDPSVRDCLRSNRNRSIVVVCNYNLGPITAEPCRAKASPLHPSSILFRPHHRRPAALSLLSSLQSMVEAPGTAPGSERLISTAFIAIAGRIRHPEYRRTAARMKGPRRYCAASHATHRSVSRS